MSPSSLDWDPAEGGLWLRVDPATVPAYDASAVPPEAVALDPSQLHLTLLRSKSMAPLVPLLGAEHAEVVRTAPPMPTPRLDPTLRRATRGPHPTKDPPNETRPRTTWFFAAENQDELRKGLAAVVSHLDAAARARGGTFPHPEPDRFFHVSRLNDRGGDPRRSIGDISAGDG